MQSVVNRPTGRVSRNRQLTRKEMSVFQKLLYSHSGIVLGENKQAMVEARVNGRLRDLNIKTFDEYLAYLRRDTGGTELVNLIDSISTNVTQFFRETDHFDFLVEEVRRLVRSGQRRIRIWSAACSTGEEPYSIAMTLQSLLAYKDLDLKILASDISTQVLDQAMRGVYSGKTLENVPPRWLEEYFIPEGRWDQPAFRIKNGLKNLIMFRRVKLNRFPYPIKGVFDVIFCCNCMIYFDRSLRQRTIAEFTKLLRPGGYLVTGHSETLVGIKSSLTTVKPSIYCKQIEESETNIIDTNPVHGTAANTHSMTE